MGLLSQHFQDQCLERFGFVMSEDEAEDRWQRGYVIRDAGYYKLHMSQRRNRVYRIVIINRCPAIMVRSTQTRQFMTVFEG